MSDTIYEASDLRILKEGFAYGSLQVKPLAKQRYPNPE